MSSEVAAPSRLKVEVNYTGILKPVAYEPHEHVRAIFERACNEFGIPESERGSLGLYLPDATDSIPLDVSAEQAGIRPDATLTLRGPAGGG
jgi:hypothetical protein